LENSGHEDRTGQLKSRPFHYGQLGGGIKLLRSAGGKRNQLVPKMAQIVPLSPQLVTCRGQRFWYVHGVDTI
jgi:hypothetical protein